MDTNKSFIQKAARGRFSIVYLYYAFFMAFSFAVRLLFLQSALPFPNLAPRLIINIFTTGLFFDIVIMTYSTIPLVLYLLIVPGNVYQSRFQRALVYCLSYATLYVLVFNSFAEYFYFGEFVLQYNPGLVGYLFFMTEAVDKISLSISMINLLIAVAVVSLTFFIFSRKKLDSSLAEKGTMPQNIITALILLCLPVIWYFTVDLSRSQMFFEKYAEHLSREGIYGLFTKFSIKQIEYETSYTTRKNDEVFRKLRSLLKEENSSFLNDDIFDVTRRIVGAGKEKRLNVVVIVEESLNAEFMEAFGNKDRLTPNLDKLSKQGMLFTNLLATGIGTRRGLEAITLSLPPTPGTAIINRPNNENLFSWGLVMQEKGYDTKFIYGGYGYRANYDYFFSHNGFDVIDRMDFEQKEITFENKRAVSDEDLFNKAIVELQKSHAAKRPFFAVILTASHNRPYTYPAGRAGVPSDAGKPGALRYADYAFGKFMKDAREKPWFGDTVFVIVADHSTFSAEKSVFSVRRYEIPLLIYSPKHVSPQRVDTLASQIDIAPTVLGLLNFSYTTKFFGRDVLKMKPDEGRAFLGNYQKLGFMKNNRLVVLDSGSDDKVYRLDREKGDLKKPPSDDSDADDMSAAISYYQGAAYLFKHGLYNFPKN